MRGGVPIFVAFAPSLCFSTEAVNHLCPSNKPKKFVSGLVLQESTTILQLEVYIVFVMKNKLGTHLGRSVLLIWLHSFSHLPRMQGLWIIGVFSFFHEVSHHKVRKVAGGSQFLQIRLEGLAWRA